MGDKAVAAIVRHLERNGLTVTRAARGGHLRVYAGRRLVTVIPYSGKARGVNRWVYVRAYLRRAGIDIPDMSG